MIVLRSVWLATVLLVAPVCLAQVVMSIADYRKQGDLETLDSLYISGVDADSTKAAFAGREEQFISSYSAFYKELDTYLAAHGFAWDDTTRCFNKLYFNADGRMDKYLYGFRGQVPREKQARFEELTGAFLKGYRFPMTSAVPFRQCGPSTFIPKPPVRSTTSEP